MNRQKKISVIATVLVMTTAVAVYAVVRNRLPWMASTYPREVLTPGAAAPHIRVLETSSLNETVLRFGQGRYTILYLFSPNCTWCEQNWPYVRSLRQQLPPNHDLVAVSVSGPELYEDRITNSSWPRVYVARPGASVIAAYKVRVTPQTVIVDPNGLIVHAWQGAWVGPVGLALERYLHAARE